MKNIVADADGDGGDRHRTSFGTRIFFLPEFQETGDTNLAHHIRYSSFSRVDRKES